MLRAFGRFFQKRGESSESFIDSELGNFRFERGLGWRGRICLGDEKAEMVLGSDGEIPSEEMLRRAKSWLRQWQTQKPKIWDYIRGELDTWPDEPNLPHPSDLSGFDPIELAYDD